FYGGLIAAVGVGLWLVKKYKLPVWTTGDLMAPGIALGHVVGRFGCFFAGCCYGSPTTKPWGIVFSDPFAAANVGTPLGVHLHPTQLYEAAAELVILGILLLVERKKDRFAGFTFWLYILLYAISRYLIEIFRGDERGTVGIFSTSQFISLLLVPLAIGMLLYLARRKAPAPKSERKRAA
ncbi:MAG TPA: prolipoprotein diacylglyceryl transferase family protein, partial [Vicinamibacterales bacterium]|nr:prolipoprotein diacylglyceryl transferase family protein [Vicinamibacterales bacterium]